MKRMIVIPVLLGLLWTGLLLVLFLWNVAGERRHIQELAEYQARAFFQQILATRAWNAAHGGVFVPVGAGAAPNPHLPLAERVLTAANGETLARINPAYMTRQIADIAAQSAGVHFRITSLAPVRPENAPDAWEREALTGLPPGGDRFELVPGRPGGDQFRFLAPLVAEESCRGCHPGLAIGSVRGGISVSVPAGPLLASRERNQRTLAATYGIIWVVGLLGLGGSTFEISRRREKAEALSRMKSRFLANMSHDMRTPLTGIIGLSERLLREDLSPRAERYARLVIHSAGSLLEIVGDILDVSRLDSGRLELEARPFSPRRAVEQATGIFAFTARDKGLDFSVRVAPQVPQNLTGDAFRYRQVLANLLGNAVKFTERGAVRLDVDAQPTADPRQVRLRTVVSDTGVGIAPQNQGRIFECFSQVDDSLARRHAGSGLGLSIARELARMMGGDIAVDRAPGRGSAFTVPARLAVGGQGAPAEETAGRTQGPPGGPDPALAGLRVLVVDDHNVNRILLNDILREDGAEVRLAAGGAEALSVFAATPCDLVLLDLQMPGLDGAQVVRRLRGMETELGRGRTPILILTAFALPGDQDLLPAGEIEGVLAKPIDVAALHRAMRAAAGARPLAVPAAVGDPPPPPAPIADAAPPGPGPGGELLAPDEALRLLGGRRDLYRLLASDFLDSAPELAAAFEEATRRGDLAEAGRAMHTLKSGAASLGAAGLRDTAARLERLARTGEAPPEADTRALRDMLDRTNQALRRAVAA
ncbi:ATP-binding protein [Solidesulfovibrio sp.]|uniref:ATP-binding protein n=1 Tax=Solidesulfovibrio sp. TaxID=2910990 RepID=UPI002B21A4CD|nr:ATP-binding protein [Solidesulfovibrio sp.]MEA4856313.1 ATP-binding protein [Solidesulfovibrio sp.]